MEISLTGTIQPILPVDRADVPAQHNVAGKIGSASGDPIPAEPKVFIPSPPLRPNVQDYVDIDRTLLSLSRHG